MKILVGCETSGIIRDAFIRAGHDAWSCDILDTQAPGPHLKCDIFDALEQNWDRLIVHPDCTYLCVSGMHWTTRGLRPQSKTDDAIKFAERLWASPVGQIALENPVSVLSTRSNLGKPTQIIQPYYFGEDASKKTCLWLKNLPRLKLTKFIKPRMVCKCGNTFSFDAAHGCPACGAEQSLALPRWSNQTDSGQNRLGPSKDRWQQRAKSYEGVAKAMVAQWL